MKALAATLPLVVLLSGCGPTEPASETAPAKFSTQFTTETAAADEDDRPPAIIKPCKADIAAGKSLGIVAVPAEFQDTYGKLFCKYTEVLAPNGRPIRLFAQDEITHDQVVYARQVLKFYIEDVPGSRYGSDKTALANRIADSGETLLLLNGHDGEFPVFNNEDWEHISGCALYHDEIAPPRQRLVHQQPLRRSPRRDVRGDSAPGPRQRYWDRH